jgi:hypothetical protein
MEKEFVSRTKDRFELGIFLSCITFGLAFAIAYEAFFERTYWVNTWKLYRYLKRGEVKFVSGREVLKDIDEVIISINGNDYTIWLYKSENSFTLHGYIGLFCGSLITKILRKRIYKRLTRLISNKFYDN